MKEKYINPFTDFGFKKLFGTEFNKPLLIDFLNEVIGAETGKIKSLQYLSSEKLAPLMNERKAIFDIYCENEQGEKFIVELQKAKQNYFKDRSVYYSTFPIQEQAQRGDWNFKLKAVYTIGILDFIFEEDKADNEVFHHEVKMLDTRPGKVFFDKLTYIYLEMPKFNKTEAELETHFDKWLYILKNLEKLNTRPKKLQEKIFSQLFEQAEIAQYTPAEFKQYEDSLKYYRDLKNTVDTAHYEGKIEGMIEGEIKGKKEGIKEGIKEGKKEAQIESVIKFYNAGVAIDLIEQGTGLNVEEIQQIIEGNKSK